MATPPVLSPDARRKLVGLLGMLGSSHAGERDNAAQLATRMVRGAGLAWDQLLVTRLEARHEPPRPEPPPVGWRELARRCTAYAEWLSAWERDFLGGLSRRTYLSAKQFAALDRIALKLRSQGFAV
jgi:hypothetical protein